MPGPSERKRRERIEDAFTAVAEEIVKRREGLRAKGKSGSSFRWRTIEKDGADAAVMIRAMPIREMCSSPLCPNSKRRAASRCAAMRRVHQNRWLQTKAWCGMRIAKQVETSTRPRSVRLLRRF